jgi:hypothetical protein
MYSRNSGRRAPLDAGAVVPATTKRRRKGNKQVLTMAAVIV